MARFRDWKTLRVTVGQGHLNWSRSGGLAVLQRD
jgi:hypothetical protein